MSKKLNLKQISANFLLVCGMISALCATFAEVKDTFFKEERTTKNEAAITQTIHGLPPGATVSKTMDINIPEDQPVTQSMQIEESRDYTWIIILVISLTAVGGGIILRKQLTKEIKESV
jgi:hypothetical protein